MARPSMPRGVPGTKVLCIVLPRRARLATASPIFDASLSVAGTDPEAAAKLSDAAGIDGLSEAPPAP